MIENDETIDINSKCFLKKKKSFYLNRLIDIKDTFINLFKRNQFFELNHLSNNTSNPNNFKTSDNFLETQITLTSSTEKRKILKKKLTNFNLLFSKNTFLSNPNDKDINAQVTPKIVGKKQNLYSFNSIDNFRNENGFTFGNMISPVIPGFRSPNLLQNAIPKTSKKVITSLRSNKKNIINIGIEDEEADDDSIYIKSVNTLSSHYDSTEGKTKTFLEYRKVYAKEKYRNFDPKNTIRLNSNENSSIDFTSSQFIKPLTGGFQIKKRDVLISSFLTNDLSEQRPPDKFNYVDCLAIDNLYRTFSNKTQTKKENLCNQIHKGRAKYIFDKAKKPKLRKVSSIYDVSKETLIKNDKYLDERKKVSFYSKMKTGKFSDKNS